MSHSYSDELTEIQKANDSLLLPSEVVSFARNPKTALHSHFEWNNDKGGEQWRLQQARMLIRTHVTVRSTENPEPIRTFVSLRSDRNTGGGYRLTVAVLDSAALSSQLLADAIEALKVVANRYRQVTALKPVWDAIRKISVLEQESPAA